MAYLRIGVWLDPNGEKIPMASHDEGGFITTINADPASKRGHPNLFMKLARCMRGAGVRHPVIDEEDQA